MYWIVILIIVNIASLLYAIKKHIDMLAVLYIVVSKGVEISDTDMRDAVRFTIKKLFERSERK